MTKTNESYWVAMHAYNDFIQWWTRIALIEPHNVCVFVEGYTVNAVTNLFPSTFPIHLGRHEEIEKTQPNFLNFTIRTSFFARVNNLIYLYTLTNYTNRMHVYHPSSDNTKAATEKYLKKKTFICIWKSQVLCHFERHLVSRHICVQQMCVCPLANSMPLFKKKKSSIQFILMRFSWSRFY